MGVPTYINKLRSSSFGLLTHKVVDFFFHPAIKCSASEFCLVFFEITSIFCTVLIHDHHLKSEYS